MVNWIINFLNVLIIHLKFCEKESKSRMLLNAKVKQIWTCLFKNQVYSKDGNLFIVICWERLQSEVFKSLILESGILASSPGFVPCEIYLGNGFKFYKTEFPLLQDNSNKITNFIGVLIKIK